MKIAIIGSGYVGLVTGTCFAELGNDIICVDNDKTKVKSLKEGEIPFYEPGLQELVTRNVKEGRLSFTDKIGEAVEFAEVIFIAVGTPSRPNGEADLSYVDNVAREIAKHMKSYKLVVEKSTVPVETGEKVMQTIKRYNKQNVPFDVASNPEFLREGSAIEDFLKPDRVVVGVQSDKAASILKKLYEPLNTNIIVTDIKSAEIIKHASNSFLATKISFINAVANICEFAGADIQKVSEGMGLDRRIGKQFLYAGIGYGGSCFPKDVDAFVKQLPPYPIPAYRNCFPILLSRPIPSETFCMSAPANSHMFASALMKEIFVARKEFDACFIISALFMSVTIMFVLRGS